MSVEASVALSLTPFLIHQLGETVYGIWIIIGSLTGYLGVLDFGLRSSVGRHLALYHARDDRDGVLEVINSAGLAMTVIGVFSFAVVAVVSQFLGAIVSVPEDFLPQAQSALLIVGINLGCNFLLKIFDAALWSYQRFDLLNMVDTVAVTLRFVLAIAVVSHGYGLIGLAYVSMFLTLLVGAAKLLLTKVVDREIRFSYRHIRLTTLHNLWNFGIWNSVNSVASMARSQATPVVVGATLGAAFVTPLSVVTRLLLTAWGVMGAGTNVLIPLSTALHARDQDVSQRRLFLDGSKLCVAAALFFYALFVVLGQSLLKIWIGPTLASAWVPLVILASGELIPMSISMAEVIFLATAKNRPSALRSVAECAMALCLAIVLWRPFGLNGVCAALAVSAAIWRGIFGLLQATRIIGISPGNFLAKTVIPMSASILPSVGLLYLVTWNHRPDSWLALTLYAAVFSVVYWTASLLTIFGWSRLRQIVST